MMSDEHDYLRIRDAARYLGVSTATLRNWDRAGKIPAYRHPVNDYRLFKREDLAAILRQIERSRSRPTMDRPIPDTKAEERSMETDQ